MKKSIITILLMFFTSSIAQANTCGGVVYFDNSSVPPDTSVNANPPPDQGYIDPVLNHKHAIGMHSVRYRISGHSHWHYGEVSVDEGTSQKIDIRIKVKEKEGWEQSNVCVDLYYSENRWFSRSHDTKLSTKCIKKLKKKEKESKYFHNINLSNLETGHHYYFADIRYGSDHNISSRSDKTEFVVVNVQNVNHKPKGYVDIANCNTISGWTSDEDTVSPLNIHIYDGATFLTDIYVVYKYEQYNYNEINNQHCNSYHPTGKCHFLQQHPEHLSSQA